MSANVFESSKVISTGITNLMPILEDVKRHFENQGFAVRVEPSVGGAVITISKGTGEDRLSLNTEIKLYGGKASVHADIGDDICVSPEFLGLTGFVGLGISGYEGTNLEMQSKLDDEMVEVVEASIIKHDPNFESDLDIMQSDIYCICCGKKIPADSRFCPNCGKKQ